MTTRLGVFSADERNVGGCHDIGTEMKIHRYKLDGLVRLCCVTKTAGNMFTVNVHLSTCRRQKRFVSTMTCTKCYKALPKVKGANLSETKSNVYRDEPRSCLEAKAKCS